MPPTPKKDEDPIVFEDLHGDVDIAEDDDADPFASFEEGEDPFAMPDMDRDIPVETKKRTTIEAVEDDDADDKELVGQEEAEHGDDTDGDPDEDNPDEDDGDDELAGIKSPALREKILADRRRIEAQDAEISQLSQITANQTKSILENKKKEIGGKIDNIKTEIVKAKEDGESTVEVDKLADLQAAQIELSQVTFQEEQLAASPPPKSGPPQKGLRARSPEAQKYLDANSWLQDDRFQTEREAMGVIDKGLGAEGYDINSSQYFEELDRRLRIKFTNLPGRGKSVEKDQKSKTKKRSSVAGVDRGGVPKGRSRSGRVTLDAEDRANMQRFSLDPSNPDHVKAYAAEKRAIGQQEEQRQR